MIFFTFGKTDPGSCRLVLVLAVKFTFTTASLLTSDLIAFSLALAIISFIGQAGVVSTTVKDTEFPLIAISFTMFSVTISLPRSGSCTFLNASKTFSGVILIVLLKRFICHKINHWGEYFVEVF